jgi:hypothetical protein
MMGGVMSGLAALDTWVFLLINRSLQNPLFDLVMPVLSAKRYFVLPAAVAILMLLVWGGRRMWVVLAVGVVALALADLGTNLIKAALERTRPCHVIPVPAGSRRGVFPGLSGCPLPGRCPGRRRLGGGGRPGL